MFQVHQSTRWQRGKRRLITSIILTLLVSLVGLSTSVTAQAQKANQALPVFDINVTNYDFGEVFVGEELLKTFTVRNLGAAPLQLADQPILSGTPTIGRYREAPLGARPLWSALTKTAAHFTGAAPYT